MMDRIVELENKIGAGLIEEVIQVAEGELKLIDKLLQSKVYVSLASNPLSVTKTNFLLSDGKI